MLRIHAKTWPPWHNLLWFEKARQHFLHCLCVVTHQCLPGSKICNCKIRKLQSFLITRRYEDFSIHMDLTERVKSLKQVRLWNAFKTENSGIRDFFPSEVDPPTLATTCDTYIYNFVSCPRPSFLSQYYLWITECQSWRRPQRSNTQSSVLIYTACQT